MYVIILRIYGIAQRQRRKQMINFARLTLELAHDSGIKTQ